MSLGLSEPRILDAPLATGEAAADGMGCELARHPESGKRPRWRLSLYRIETPMDLAQAAGRRRWLGLSAGGPLEVEHADGQTRLAAEGAELSLSGPASVRLRPVDAPARLLELVHVEGLTWQAKRVRGSESLILGAQTDLIVHACGPCRLRCGETVWSLDAGQTWCSTLQDLVFFDIETTDGACALVLIIDRSELPGRDAAGGVPAADDQADAESAEPDEDDIDPDLFPRNARVRRGWSAPQPPAPPLPAGSVVVIGRPEPRLPGWVYFTTARGQQGLVREDQIRVDGLRARLEAESSAIWLSVADGDTVELLGREHGCYRARLADGREGLLPTDAIDDPPA